MGRTVRILPLVALRTTMFFLSLQAAKRMSLVASMARPAQPPLTEEMSYLPVTVRVVGVDDGDGVLVFEVDEEVAVVVEDGLLDGAACVEGFEDVAGSGVEDGDVGGDVGEDVDADGWRGRRDSRRDGRRC